MSWPEVSLLDCCKLSTGKYDANHGGAIGDYPFYTCADKPIRANTYSFDGQSIILPGNGANVGLVLFYDGKFEAYQRTYVLNNFATNVDSRFVLYHLLRNWRTKNINSQFGSATNYIRLQNFVDYKIKLPPLAEQKRIAAILDKADSLRRKNKQAIQLGEKFLRAMFLDMFGDPVSNPKGWNIKKLKDISLIQIGPFGTQLHKEDYVEGGIPLINPTHIVNGKIVPKINLTVPINKHAELGEYHLKAGDIIMGRRGEMGRCAIVTEHEENWLCGTGSLYIRPHNPGIVSEYICTLLSGSAIKKQLQSESLGATMDNLNKTIVGNIDIPVPNEDTLKKYSLLQEKAIKSIDRIGSCSGDLLFNTLSQKAYLGNL